MVIRTLSKKAMLLATVASLALVGCTTQNERIGADDGSDRCRPQRVALDSTGNYFAEDIVKGAAIGAVGGALIGALTGGSNAGRNALIGGLAGAAAGAAGGYWASLQQQNKDQASLLTSISNDLSRENDQIDKTQLAFAQLNDCRRDEANRVRADLAAGRLTRPQAEQAMAGVKARAAEDLRIARQINAKLEERGANFQFANEPVNPPAPAPVAVAPAPAPSRAPTAQAAPRPAPQQAAPQPPRDPQKAQVAQATSTNLAKREQFAQSVQTAQANQSAFELT
ncbi:MAG: YMGG-like glycine zipper-containing protein [Elsteraceae bacterium]